MPNGTIVQSYSGLKRTYWKVQKYQTPLTPSKRHLMQVLTLSLIKNVPKQVVKFLVLWLTGSRMTTAFMRQPPSRAVSSLTAPASSYQRGKWIDEKLAEFAQKKKNWNGTSWETLWALNQNYSYIFYSIFHDGYLKYFPFINGLYPDREGASPYANIPAVSCWRDSPTSTWI